MICWCQNMTLSTMIVLKLHEVSLYIVISGLISTIILHVLFSLLFFPLMNSQSFFTLHYYLTLYVRQFALLFYLYLFNQCCYNLFSSTVFLWFPILWLQSLSTTSFLSSTVCTSLCYSYFIRWWYPSYIHINQCYIWQHVLFAFYFLLCLNSHISFLSFFAAISWYFFVWDTVNDWKIIYVKLNSQYMFWIPVHIGYFPAVCSINFFYIWAPILINTMSFQILIEYIW